VSATPAVDADTVYFPDWAGNLYAVDKWTGVEWWRTSIAAASGVPGDKARATPAVAGNKLIIGTQGPFGGGRKVLAFDKDTGALLWSTTLDTHPAAIITQSATVFGNRVYVGTSLSWLPDAEFGRRPGDQVDRAGLPGLGCTAAARGVVPHWGR
jgi:polyvinyl alcohol dehydrogenase (cytochrome)